MDWKQAYQEVYKFFQQSKKQRESPVEEEEEEEELEGRGVSRRLARSGEGGNG